MGAASRAAGRRLQTPRSRKSPNKGATFASRAPICPPVAASQLPPPTRRSIMLRSEEHTSELQSLMRISYAVFCLKKKKHKNTIINNADNTQYNETKIYSI